MTFDLRHMVREIHDGTDITDHAEMAEAVIAQIPARDRKAALLVAMTEYCRWASTSFRSSSPVPTGPPNTASWKRQGIQEYWQRRMHERYLTADGVKLLGECTAADLVFMAEELERQAAAKLAKATGWRDLASWMAHHGIDRVSDLPTGVVAAKLQDAA